MPRRRKRSNKGRGGSPQWLPFNDYAGGVLGPGDQALWIRRNFSIPSDRTFFIRGVHIQAIAEAASGSQQTVGGACMQVELYNPPASPDVSNQFWNSGPLIIGSVPFKRYFRMKSLPFPDSTSPQATLLAFSNICQRKTDTGSIRYVARLDVALSPEEFNRKCPNLAGPFPSTSPPSSLTDDSECAPSWSRPTTPVSNSGTKLV